MLERIDWDFKNGAVGLTLADGRSEVLTSPKLVPPVKTAIRRAAIDYGRSTMTLELPLGPVEVALGWAGDRDLPPPERPIVYLDQCQWSTLEAATWRPSARVDARERAAADRIIELARNHTILLPFSSAHALETGPLHSERRQHHASMVLELSGGWQMRNPVGIRARELQRSLAGEDPRARGVFTLEPNILFAAQKSAPAPSGSPLEEALERVTWMLAVYETFLDDEGPDMTEARAQANRWVAWHEAVSSAMAVLASQKERRQMAREFLLTDLQAEIATAATRVGIHPERTALWHAERMRDGLASLPYVGRWEAVLFHRLSNTEERWVPNDLLDLNFLAATAAYADVMVGERRMSAYLRRVEPAATKGAVICSKLHDALPHIESLVASRASAEAA